MVRLGVNIDHVATLREARGEDYPCIERAAQQALQFGADQITIHLRKDRRHIQDADLPIVKKVCKEFQKPLNLEIGADEQILEIAIQTAPEWICIVPENRQEITTEGGLNVLSKDVFIKVKYAIDEIKKSCPNTKVSLFVESDLQTLEKCKELGAHACEIHTGEYAKAFLEKRDYSSFLTSFSESKKYLNNHEIGCHAGHGLTLESVGPLVDEDLFVEYNIGHWIVSEAIFKGFENVISGLKRRCQKK